MIQKKITANNTNKNFNKSGLAFLSASLIMIMMLSLIAFSANALTDSTRPTILSISVSPANNEEDVSRNEQITVVFSEDMNPLTINENTFMLMQRTTPESGNFRYLPIKETLSYSNRTVTFSPKNNSSHMFSPNQQYGNVFTVTITNETKDTSNNSLSRNYVWSFTTGKDSFNTGITTSNLNQSSIPVNSNNEVNESNQTQLAEPVFVVTPIGPTNEPTNTESTSLTSFFASIPLWLWIVSGLALLLLIGLIIAYATNSSSSESSTEIKTYGTAESPFGDVHPVIKIEGIGTKYNEKLSAMGIHDTKQLWEADALEVSDKTGAPLSLVKGWQNMSELASIKGIGPQYAELLERSGIHSILSLKEYDPDKLLKLIRKKQNSLKINIQGNSPGHSTVENWIDEAKDHKLAESEFQTA